MMPSTMILTICISMVLELKRDLSLDIGSRYERAEHKTYNSTHKSQNWNEKYRTLISSARYVGLVGSGLGGRSRPPRQKFSPTNRTLVVSLLFLFEHSIWAVFVCCDIDIILGLFGCLQATCCCSGTATIVMLHCSKCSRNLDLKTPILSQPWSRRRRRP